jgi:methyl-accepting chemotaxis protein
VIEQYLAGALIGSALCAALVSRLQKTRRNNAVTTLRGQLEARANKLREANARLDAELTGSARSMEALQSENRRLQQCVEEQARSLEELRGALARTAAQKSDWAHEAGRIAGEAARLKGLAATFERWHEQMNSLMAQNEDMHAKNEELASIVKHVVIVSLNASIEASRAGPAGRGFAVVANEVRTLALRTEGLSKDYSNSLHRNDLTTTATFQDIQAGGKMIMASLSSIESFSNRLHSRLEQGD